MNMGSNDSIGTGSGTGSGVCSIVSGINMNVSVNNFKKVMWRYKQMLCMIVLSDIYNFIYILFTNIY